MAVSGIVSSPQYNKTNRQSFKCEAPGCQVYVS